MYKVDLSKEAVKAALTHARKTQSIKIELTGKEDGDLKLSREEVFRLLDEGYFSGSERNESGSFSFEVKEEVKEGLFQPAANLAERVRALASQATFFRETPASEMLRVCWTDGDDGKFLAEDESTGEEYYFNFSDIKPGAEFHTTYKEVV